MFDSVLEIGCQWGENLVAIQDEFKGKKLVGIDIDIRTLKQASFLVNDITLIEGNAKKVDFPDKSFDVVFSQALFCMLRLSEAEDVLTEMIRLSKKYIYFVELDINEMFGLAGERLAFNWIKLLDHYRLKATKEKISPEVWNASPWIKNGYLIKVEL